MLITSTGSLVLRALDIIVEAIQQPVDPSPIRAPPLRRDPCRVGTPSEIGQSLALLEERNVALPEQRQA